MIKLNQHQFQWAAQIRNVLEGYQSFFRRSPGVDFINATADRLALWGYRGAQVDDAVKSLLNRDDEKFPTANQIRDIAKTNKANDAKNAVDPQAEKDREKYLNHRKQFEKALGPDIFKKYIEVWHHEFFKGAEGLGIFENLIPSGAFDQVAVADLARANGNAKRAIQLVRAEKQRHGQVNQPDSEFYEDDNYKVFRVGRPRFIVKQTTNAGQTANN